MAVALTFSGTAKAQTPPSSCNLKAKVEELRKESSPFGPGLLVRAVDRDLKSFEKNVNELMNKPGILPSDSRRRAILEKQFRDYASVSGDQSEFNELLLSVAAKDSDLCTRCRLLPTWKIFSDAEFPNVTQEILESARGREIFRMVELDSKSLVQEKSLGDRSSQTIIDGLRIRIRNSLDLLTFGEATPRNWSTRYPNERGMDDGAFARSMKSLTSDQCPG